jgi:hypothetical protein
MGQRGQRIESQCCDTPALKTKLQMQGGTVNTIFTQTKAGISAGANSRLSPLALCVWVCDEIDRYPLAGAEGDQSCWRTLFE